MAEQRRNYIALSSGICSTQTLLEMSVLMKVVMLLKSMVTMLIKGHHVEVGVGVLPSREGRRCYSGL